jgi:L-asparaginase
MPKRPKICVLFAGGTLGMLKNRRTDALEPATGAAELIQQIPEIQKYLQLDLKIITNIDSSNMAPSHWTEIADKIHSLYDRYEGFVVIQGTDTMAYTASALSFALQNLSKPVILTGSLIPLSEIGADARTNLIYACLTAAENIAEVCITFSNKIIRGNRAKKHHESFTDVFHSPNYPCLGELGRPSSIYEWAKKRRKRILKVQSKFDEKISLIKLFPGFDPKILDRVIDRGAHGIIIEGFGPGNIPFMDNSILPQIKKCTKLGIPLIVANQMERGITNLNAYEAGLEAKKAGAISSHDMTTEAVVTKLMWALANKKSIKEIKKTITTPLAGEMRE